MTAGARLVLGAVWLLVGCKREAPPPPPAPSAPWPAPAVSSAPVPSRVLRYRVAPPSRVSFELPAASANPRGSIDVIRGEASIDLANLARSRAELSIDLGALRMSSERDGGEIDRQHTLEALNWLALGPSLPEAERDRRRWAKVQVALDGGARRGRPGSELVLGARASITINDRRVERRFDVRARLRYPGAEADGAAPEQIDVETTRPVEISLTDHRIEPRNALGRLIAEDLKLLGEKVGRTAKISVSLRLVPAS